MDRVFYHSHAAQVVFEADRAQQRIEFGTDMLVVGRKLPSEFCFAPVRIWEQRSQVQYLFFLHDTRVVPDQPGEFSPILSHPSDADHRVHAAVREFTAQVSA